MFSEDSDDNFLSADEGSEKEEDSTDRAEAYFNENLGICNNIATDHSSVDIKHGHSDEILKNDNDFGKVTTSTPIAPIEENILNLFSVCIDTSDALANNLLQEYNPHLDLDKIYCKNSENVLRTADTCETKDLSSSIDLITSSETTRKIEIPSPNIKSIKESKIGLKKPREKLGARLGNKKLGARVTKPLIGISCDSVENQYHKKSSFADASPNKFEDFLAKDVCKSTDLGEEFENTQHQEISSHSNWGSWGGWSSTLATAASTLTKEVSRGMETVMESVESTLGAPDPEVLANESFEIEKKLKEMDIDEDEEITSVEGGTKNNSKNIVAENDSAYGFGFSGFGKLMSGVSGAIESASNTVLLGGLETLEKIGRKTMDVIQEGDPGLRRKRAFLHSKKPNLSVVLREARERAFDEEENKNADLSGKGAQPLGIVSIELIWEGTEGSAHLEALSLVAKQCNSKTSSIMQEIPALGLNRLQPFIAKIKACSEIDEGRVCGDLSRDLNKITRDVQLPVKFHKLLTGWPSFENFVKKLSIEIQTFNSDEKQLIDMQKDLLTEVAVIVSCIVGVTHKVAELCLISSELNYVLLAEQFKELCSRISDGLERSADHICESVTQTLPSSDAFVGSAITNIYVQMAEANSYLQNSLQHLTTVLIQAQAKQIASAL